MEAETTRGWSAEQYEYELDKSLENVMPETWMGHARIVLAEEDTEWSEARRTGILQRTERLVSENEYPAERVANKFLSRLAEME